ncbi:hypothetical protein ES702_07390 [subsurface metagenome]
MENKSYEGMTIRVPVDIARELKELRKDKDLPSYGSALKYWIEQQRDEQIDTRLNEIEEKIKKMTKILDIFVNKVDKLFNRLLDALFKINKRTEARLNSLEAKQVEKIK